MIRGLTIVLLILTLVYCSTSKFALERETVKETNLEKTIFYSNKYVVVNSSFNEDARLLNAESLIEIKDFFDNNIYNLLEKNDFSMTNQIESKHTLSILNFNIKEFKLEVEGPQVNVLTLKIDYRLKGGSVDTTLIEEVNKESIVAFDELATMEICRLATNNITKQVKLLFN